MLCRFTKHYTRAEVSALLPQVRRWLKRLRDSRDSLERREKALTHLIKPGCDLGGEQVNGWVRALAGLREALYEFYRREIQVKDLDRGLLDFPAILDGKEVFLCWEQEEEDIGFWHDLDAGYAGRERLEDE